MTSSNNSDFKKQAAEADNEREREMRTRAEAQQLKLEIDKQINEDDNHDKSIGSVNYQPNITANSVMSDSTFSSKYSSRTSSIEPMAAVAVDSRLKQLEEENREYKLSYIQLIDEKEALTYQIGLIRDQMDDLFENLRNANRELSEKRKEWSFQKHQIDELTFRCKFLKNQVDLRDQLIIDNNLVISDDVISVAPSATAGATDQSGVTVNGTDQQVQEQLVKGTALLSRDLAEQLKQLSETSLENCIRKLFEQNQKQLEDIKALQMKLNEERDESEVSIRKDERHKYKESDYDTLKQNYQSMKNQCQEFKRQFQLSQQKVTALEADVIRLEGQVKRHKSIAESCEKQEEELKQSKRKYQRELREAQSKIEDLKSENTTLLKKLDKCTKQKSKKETN